MADEQKETVSETVSIEPSEGEGDPIARLEAKLDALLNSHEQRIAALESGVGGYATAEHEHEYAGREHEHGETRNEPGSEERPAEREESSGARETAPRSSHWYYRSIGEHFHR